MAVLNKYTNPDIAAGKVLTDAGRAQGSKLVLMAETFEIAASDDDGSIFRVFKDVPSTLIPVKGEIFCDAITGGTNFDLGLYANLDSGGAAIDSNLFMAGQTLATALTTPANALSALDIADRFVKQLWELAVPSGPAYTQQTRPSKFDIALTANTIGTAAGTVTIALYFRNP